MIKANRTSENGSTTKLPITSKTSTTALEKAAFIVKAEPGAKKSWGQSTGMLISWPFDPVKPPLVCYRLQYYKPCNPGQLAESAKTIHYIYVLRCTIIKCTFSENCDQPPLDVMIKKNPFKWYSLFRLIDRGIIPLHKNLLRTWTEDS